MDLIQRSQQIIKQNQSPSGAYVASPTFSQYGFSWLRDGMWIAHSMDCVGDHASATAFHRWAAATLLRYEARVNSLLGKLERGEALAERDYLPTRFAVDGSLGAEDWPDFQLDGYGAWLWGLVQHCQQHHAALWDELRPAVSLLLRYLAALWQHPNYDCWEEFRDEVHTSTLATLYGGLAAIEAYDATLIPLGLTQTIRAFVLDQAVAAEGHFMKYIGSSEADASLLWLAVPFALVDIHDPAFQLTLRKIETDLLRPGGGVYRYRADTYFGGGEWLLLTCWLAWVYLCLERRAEAEALLRWVEAQAETSGDMPEQVSHHTLDPAYYQPWVERWGPPASPLLWSHAMYLIVRTKLETL